MSKIGKISIDIPDKVKLALNGNLLQVEGPLGKSKINLDIEMFELDINNEKKNVSIKPKVINQTSKRFQTDLAP